MPFLDYLRSSSNSSPRGLPKEQLGPAGEEAAPSTGDTARPTSPHSDSEDSLVGSTVTEALPTPSQGGLATVIEERERALSQDESLTRLAEDLAQEVRRRTADVNAIRKEASSQHTLLTQLAEQVLAGASPTNGAKKDDVAAVQQQMELQAGALREGLMDIQQQRSEIQWQRTALVALAERFDHFSACHQAGAEPAIAELRKEVAEVREAVGSFRDVFAGQVDELRRDIQVRRGRRSGGSDEVLPTREECAAMGRGVSIGSEAGQGTSTVEAALRKDVAEELAILVDQTEQRCLEISQALDAERVQRRSEVEAVRQQLQASTEQLEQRTLEATLPQVRQEVSDEFAKLGREQQAHFQDLDEIGLNRVGQFEQKLLAMHSKLEETVVPRSDFVSLCEEVREARSEAASQLAEGAHADGAGVRSQLEALVGSLSELDARQGASEARLTAELGRLAAAIDIAQGSVPADPAAARSRASSQEDDAQLFSRVLSADMVKLAEELVQVNLDLRRVASEVDHLKAKGSSRDRSLAAEVERVASVVDSAPWRLTPDEAAPNPGDDSAKHGGLPVLHRRMEAAEAREKSLRTEVSVCLQLSQDSAAKLPALTAQLERLEAQLSAPLAVKESSPPPMPLGISASGDASGTTVPARLVAITSAASVSFPAKSATVSVPAKAGSPLISSSVRIPSSQVKAGVSTREGMGLLQPPDTPSGSPHSIPAALHGLIEAAQPLKAGASRRKALIIACSYLSSQVPLRGTLNDAWNILSLLRHTLQYAEDQVRYLIDGSEFCKVGSQGPTKANVLEGLEWLTADAQPGDDLFLYFGGYGTQQPTGLQGDLCEGHLVPTDFAEGTGVTTNGVIGSSAALGTGGYRLVPLADISRALADLPAACKVTIVLDCCFALVPGIGPSGNSQPAKFTRVSMKPPPSIQGGDDASSFSPRTRYLDLPHLSGQRVLAANPGRSGAPEPSCLVHCFSACQQPQWCVEIPIEGVVQGAFTWAWVKAFISMHLDGQIMQLCSALKGIMAELKDHYQWLDQTPVVQLSASAMPREGQREEVKPLKMPVIPLPTNHRRRKALLVGVNYLGSNVAHAQLKGCVNDAWNLHSVLRRTLQFSEDQIRMLVDGEHGVPPQAARAPTRANLLSGLQWLVSGAQPGDSLIFLFCGYGAQHPRSPGGEEHEAYLVPSDFAAAVPVDFFLQVQQDGSSPNSPNLSIASTPVHSSSFQGGQGGAGGKGYRLVSLMEVNRLLAQLPARTGVTMVLDCSYPAMPGLSPAQNASFSRVVRGRMDYRKVRDFITRPRFLELPPLPAQHTPDHLRTPLAPECLVHCFSACRLEEWACELPLEGTVQGTFTWAFAKALAAGHYRSSASQLQEALQRITSGLKQHFQGFNQSPQLLLSRAASGENPVLCP